MDYSISLFDKFTILMEQNSRGVQIGIYSVAVFGLAVAIRRVRPFTRFKTPSDIPNNFISSRIKLSGNVARIEPNGPLLMVQHKPLISLLPRGALQPAAEALPIKIAGVNLTGNGISWLQTIVANNEISFVPVAKKPYCVDCEVTMNHRTSWQPTATSQILNIGEVLVSLGFGTVAILDPKLSKNEGYLTYYKRLLAAEKQAEKKRMGVWLYNSTSPPWHSRLIGELWNVVQTKFQKT